MRIPIKTLLLCLLLALLPLQGFANALAPTCVKAMHMDGVELPAHHAAAHCHDSAVMQHQHRDCCNGCGACCSGIAALPAAIDFAVPADLLRLHHIPANLPFSGYMPAVPERPPRLLTI